MQFILLSAHEVIQIHDSVINSGELQGLAAGKLLEGALSRIENRITYGLIRDIFDLSATYALVLAQGHVFNDANKRTAYASMEYSLHLNGVRIEFDTIELGDLVIKLAQGFMSEVEFADWLRKKRIAELEDRQKT